VNVAARQAEPADEPIQKGPLLDRRIEAGGKPYRYAVYACRVAAVNRPGVSADLSHGSRRPFREAGLRANTGAR